MTPATRCSWAKSEAEILYHDTEWGVEKHEDSVLFELLILEGMQAGLSWNLILSKRENMRKAFDGFVPQRIITYDDAKKKQLLENPGIIRNRAKINALVKNADAFLRTQQEFGSFDAFIWQFTNHKQIVNHWRDESQVPTKSPESDAMSAALKKRGFSFVGSVICYSYMQAIGMVNDHVIHCDFHTPQPASNEIPLNQQGNTEHSPC